MSLYMVVHSVKVSPEQFTLYKQIGLDIGIQYVESGPLVRSSYKAEKHLK